MRLCICARKMLAGVRFMPCLNPQKHHFLMSDVRLEMKHARAATLKKLRCDSVNGIIPRHRIILKMLELCATRTPKVVCLSLYHESAL